MSKVLLKLLATAFTAEQFPEPRGAEIVFAGRSNVGKSSLINRLAGVSGRARRDGARVSQRPGCTQSINFYEFWPQTVLVDLPGFGFLQGPQSVRSRLAELTQVFFRERPDLALVIHVVDIRLPLQALDRQMLIWAQNFKTPYLLTLNKCDKLSRSMISRRCREITDELQALGKYRLLPVSAETGFGLDECRREIREVLKKRVEIAS